MKKKIIFFIKLIFGISILIYLFSRTSVQEFVHLLSNADYKFFVISIILYILGQILSAKKWMIISEKLNFKYSFVTYLKLYFLGMFYNMFLPTNIGGDIIKFAKIKDEKTFPVKRAFLSVFSDRITGLFILVFFILIGFIFYNNNQLLNIINLGITLLSFLTLIIFIYLIKNDKYIPLKYKDYCKLIRLLFDKKCILKFMALSLIFHLILILIHYCIAQMYNLNIPLSYYLLLYPLTSIIAALPISINGIGLKEFVYVFMLKPFDIDISTSILFALTFNMTIMFASTIGFFPYLSIKDKI